MSLDRIEGCILGCAVGDALGLPWENVGPARIARRLAEGPRHAFLPGGRGVVSDDTEHTLIVGQCLLEVGADDPEAFGAALAQRMRRWLWAAPPGIGFGTLRALIKLSVGFGPQRSGVWTAGNGPAMRTALLGVCVEDRAALDVLVRGCTRITHTDPRAEEGARLVAHAAHGLARGRDPHTVLDDALGWIEGDGLRTAMQEVSRRLGQGPPAPDQPVSGFIDHTVPAALHCALGASDLRTAVTAAIRLGGDTDTVAAIAGAVAGARFGAASLPAEWVAGLAEWPRDVAWMRRLAARLASGGEPLPEPWWFQQAGRNLAVGAWSIARLPLAAWL
ncbi:MAG: ADP-ribosylglycohydrolase family protein [Myxococcales bacterium]|nr:ADP-ribosylglycohydrolase family protein [Myxococcales bacterium]